MTRLLTKPELQNQLSGERKMQIDEGLKIARHVDGLRETAAKVGVETEKFRTASVEQAKADVLVVLEEKRVAEEGRDEALAELAVARIPLDAEWERVRQEGAKVCEREDKVSNRETIVLVEEKDINDRKGAVALNEARVNDDRERARELLADAENLRQEATERRERAEAEAQNYERNNHTRELVLTNREEAASAQERRIAYRNEQQDKREQELNARETQLNDKEQTLLRNEQRDYGKRK